MNIKGLVSNVIPFAPKAKADAAPEARAHSKTDADNDREGNGQASAGGEQQKRRSFSAQEVEEVVKHLESLAGVKEHGLSIQLIRNDGITVVHVVDRDGKVIRRIPESEFGYLLGSKEKKSGNLLNRAL